MLCVCAMCVCVCVILLNTIMKLITILYIQQPIISFAETS